MRTWPVVLDTNIFVAAGFNPNSVSARLLEAAKQGHIHMVWNDATRREIEQILGQIPPLRPHALAVADLFRRADRFAGATYPERFVEIADPDDRKFAALAVAAGAALVSNDDHLLRHREHLEVPVLTPREFWRRQQHPDELPLWKSTPT